MHKFFRSGLALTLALVMCLGLSMTAFAKTDKETKGNGKGQFCDVCGTRLWQTSGGKGQSGGKYCPNCDAKAETPETPEIPETPDTPACEHVWNYESLGGTAGHQGTCLLCGEVEADATAHDYGEWKYYGEGKDVNYCLDCMYRTFRTHHCQWDDGIVNEDGSTIYTCTISGCTETKTEAAPHVHTAEWKVVQEATCTEDGRREKRCECGYLMAAEIFYATGHADPMWEITVAPKGTTDGQAAHVCPVCKEALETVEIPNFTDTSVWTKVSDVPEVDENGVATGKIVTTYSSMYGTIEVVHK